MTTTVPDAARRIVTLGGLAEIVGEHLGVSDWHTITQEQINLFADATGDHQWLHVDPERARSGPYGRTIAHGYLTLSFAPALLSEVLEVVGASKIINYGIGKARFPAPVPVGSRLRMSVDLAVAEQTEVWVHTTLRLTFEIEGEPKPACVAEILFRYCS